MALQRETEKCTEIEASLPPTLMYFIADITQLRVGGEGENENQLGWAELLESSLIPQGEFLP